ncbi:hypothetical protein J3459_011405 [Metarhizium acridum]|nr:hypothetical protein J3459_011405 [Metarhizium acridum]
MIVQCFAKPARITGAAEVEPLSPGRIEENHSASNMNHSFTKKPARLFPHTTNSNEDSLSLFFPHHAVQMRHRRRRPRPHDPRIGPAAMRSQNRSLPFRPALRS